MLNPLFSLLTILACSMPLMAEAAPERPGQPARNVLEHIIPDVAFNDVPLADALEFIRDVTGASIFVDWKAIEGAGIERMTPITARLKGARLSTLLQILLEDASKEKKLAYVMSDGILKISTAEALQPPIEKVYPVDDLLGQGERSRRNAPILINLVTGSIDPASWQPDGAGSVTINDGKMTVRTGEKNQKAVENLLKQVRELRK